MRVIKYLNGSKDVALYLGGTSDGMIELHVCDDASFAVHGEYKSHSGMCVSLGRGTTSGSSTKQKLVTKATCKS